MYLSILFDNFWVMFFPHFESTQLIFNSNNTLTCKLWDDFANHVTEYTSQNPLPIVMVLQFAQIKSWKGNISLYDLMFLNLIMNTLFMLFFISLYGRQQFCF